MSRNGNLSVEGGGFIGVGARPMAADTPAPAAPSSGAAGETRGIDVRRIAWEVRRCLSWYGVKVSLNIYNGKPGVPLVERYDGRAGSVGVARIGFNTYFDAYLPKPCFLDDERVELLISEIARLLCGQVEIGEAADSIVFMLREMYGPREYWVGAYNSPSDTRLVITFNVSSHAQWPERQHVERLAAIIEGLWWRGKAARILFFLDGRVEYEEVYPPTGDPLVEVFKDRLQLFLPHPDRYNAVTLRVFLRAAVEAASAVSSLTAQPVHGERLRRLLSRMYERKFAVAFTPSRVKILRPLLSP